MFISNGFQHGKCAVLLRLSFLLMLFHVDCATLLGVRRQLSYLSLRFHNNVIFANALKRNVASP